jgi:hypothetical protein
MTECVENTSEMANQILIILNNLDTTLSCPVCMEVFDNNRHQPYGCQYDCQNLICFDCSKKLSNARRYGDGDVDANLKICPTCRRSSKFLKLNNKMIVMMKEFNEIAEVMSKFVKHHMSCKLSVDLLQQIFEHKTTSNIVTDTVENLMQLVTYVITKASQIELDVKHNYESKMDDQQQLQKQLDERSVSIVKDTEILDERQHNIRKRESELVNLEQEKARCLQQSAEYSKVLKEYTDRKELLEDEKHIIDQSQQIIEMREQELNKRETLSRNKETDFKELQQIMETEMKQLYTDRSSYDKLYDTYIKNKTILNNSQKAFENKFRLYEKDIEQLNLNKKLFDVDMLNDIMLSGKSDADILDNVQMFLDKFNDSKQQNNSSNYKETLKIPVGNLPYVFKIDGNQPSDSEKSPASWV